MSYILDALRRAEAQRARGSLPQLHAAPVSTPTASAPRRPPWAMAAMAMLVVALVVMLASLAWWAGSRQRPAAQEPVPASMASTADRALVASTSPAPSEATAPAGPDRPPRGAPPPGAAAVTPSPVPPVSPPSPPQRMPRPAGAPVPRSLPEGSGRPFEAAPTPPRPAPAARTAPDADQPPAARPAPRVPLRSELPSEVQRELPGLALNGTVYAADPAQRMVLVNGEVWREGDRLAPGLVVDEIRRKDTVLSYKGQRFILAP